MSRPTTVHVGANRINAFRLNVGVGNWSVGDADVWDFMLTLGGTVVYSHGGRRIVHQAGDFIAVRPRTLNRWDTVSGDDGGHEPWSMIAALCDPPRQMLARFDWPEVMPGYYATRLVTPAALEGVRGALLQIIRNQNQAMPGWEDLSFNLFEQVLLLCRMHNSAQRESTDPRLLAAIEFITTHVDRPIHVDNLCRVAHLSASHLHALFVSQTGFTPMQYTERHRVGVAQRLLSSTPLRIGEVAARVGFEDQCYFRVR